MRQVGCFLRAGHIFINHILSLATLSISFLFLLEMVIAKDPSYLSLQYFMYSVTVAYHLTLCSNNIGTHNETMNSCLLLSFFFICINLKRIPYINCIILTEGVVNRTIHIICMYVYKWSVDIILIVYDKI